MPRPTILSDNEIQLYMNKFPTWTQEGNLIYKDFVAKDFPQAIAFVNAAAYYAEKLDHHPDMKIYSWNKIKVELHTHDVGGLTELDFQLAEKIDYIAL